MTHTILMSVLLSLAPICGSGLELLAVPATMSLLCHHEFKPSKTVSPTTFFCKLL